MRSRNRRHWRTIPPRSRSRVHHDRPDHDPSSPASTSGSPRSRVHRCALHFIFVISYRFHSLNFLFLRDCFRQGARITWSLNFCNFHQGSLSNPWEEGFTRRVTEIKLIIKLTLVCQYHFRITFGKKFNFEFCQSWKWSWKKLSSIEFFKYWRYKGFIILLSG